MFIMALVVQADHLSRLRSLLVKLAALESCRVSEESNTRNSTGMHYMCGVHVNKCTHTHTSTRKTCPILSSHIKAHTHIQNHTPTHTHREMSHTEMIIKRLELEKAA